jgi:hypothetical protein
VCIRVQIGGSYRQVSLYTYRWRNLGCFGVALLHFRSAMSRLDRYNDRPRYDDRRYDERSRYDDRDRPRYDDRDRDRNRYDDRDRRYDDRRDRDYRSSRYDDRDRRYDDRRYGNDRRPYRDERREGPNRRLHLANLSSEAKYDDVQRYFEKYGRVLNVDVKEGYGFVEFDSPKSARDALEGLDKTDFMGRELKVSYAKTPKWVLIYYVICADLSYRPKFTAKGKGQFRVVFENLSESTSWQDLKDFARQAGECTQSHVKSDSNGTKSGSVEFLREEDYEKALKILKNASFKGNVVRIVEVSAYFVISYFLFD